MEAYNDVTAEPDVDPIEINVGPFEACEEVKENTFPHFPILNMDESISDLNRLNLGELKRDL